MSRVKSAIRVPASDQRSLALALLACFGLLAGCAATPTATERSGETSAPAVASSVAAPTTSLPDLTQTPAANGEPAITFEKTVHDFGEVSAQSTNVCEFRFKNTGTATLKVREKIDSTCGCTAPVLSKTEYAPGEKGVIKVTYAAPSSAGPVARTLVVHSNDQRDRGLVNLSIKATVVERVAYEPRRLNLRLRGPDAGCPPITIRSVDRKSFSVTKVISTYGGITGDPDPSREGTEFTIQPSVDPEKLAKCPAGSVVVTLTHPECKVIRIPYQALPAFQFSPPSITLFNAEPNRPVPREVWLSSNYGEDFEIASCTSRINLVEVAEKEKVVSADKTSFRYRLRLSIKPPAPSGARRNTGDALVIRLTNGSSLELPCHVFYGTSRPSAPRAGFLNH